MIDEYFKGMLEEHTRDVFRVHLRISRYCRKQLDILKILSILVLEEASKKTLRRGDLF